MQFTGLLGRQFDSGVSVIDAGTVSALTPAGGVYGGTLSANLKVTAPASGLTVAVAPGYCMVPSSSAQQGGYRFGLMSAGSLTVASNVSGITRNDLVVAYVSDVGSSSSVCGVEYLSGTTSVPSNAIALAALAVPTGTANITAGMITDRRGFVCSPGGILHLPTAAAAIAAPPSQFFWQVDAARLVQGSGTAGSVTAYPSGGGATGFAYGQSGFPSLNFSADGMTDFEIYYEREPGVSGFSEIVTIQVYIDSARVDTVYTQDTSTVLGRVSATYYTSSRQGTTPSAGSHTVRLAGTATTAAHTLRISPVVV
jgi:hypothetical protein